MRSIITTVIIAILLIPGITGASGTDPRKVSVLYLGDPLSGFTPYVPMKVDAIVQVDPIPAYHHGGYAVSLTDIRRYIRIYMPRNYGEYVDRYDVMVISNAYRQSISQSQQIWFRDGVLNDGIGLTMVAGQDSFFASSSRPDASWAGSPVEDVLPVEIPTGYQVIEHNWIRNKAMRIVDYENEFIASLPYVPTPLYMRIPVNGQLVHLKDGAQQLGRWIYPELGDPPLYVTWDIGEGRTYAMMHEWANPGSQQGGRYFSQWDYQPDYSINLILYLAKRPLPSDYLVVHQYRELVQTLYIGRSMLMSLIDFVESFGGNSEAIYEEIRNLDLMVEEAAEFYLDLDNQAALEAARKAREKQVEIEEFSVKIKNQALLWVYITEWLTVSGTGLLCGFVVWSLMVRRRLYREVGTTRLQG
jgi:uncharacterized membrane protein